MFGSTLLGVYMAASGRTQRVASSLLCGHALNVSRIASDASITLKSMAACCFLSVQTNSLSSLLSLSPLSSVVAFKRL
jgi:hypothetical protein